MSDPSRRSNLFATINLQQELDKPRPYLNKVRSIVRRNPGILANSSIPSFPLSLPIVVLCTGCHEHLTQDDRTDLIKLFSTEGINRNVCGPNGRGGLMMHLNDGGDATSIQNRITCFHMLVGKNDVKTLKALASMDPPLLHPEDVWQLDLISLACCRGYLDVVKCLIELSPESLTKKNGHGNYPIFAAAMKGHEEIFHYILQKGREYQSFGTDDESMGGLFVCRTYNDFPSDAMFTPLDCWVLHKTTKREIFAPKLKKMLHGFPLLQQAMKTSMRYVMKDVLERLLMHFDCGNIKDKNEKYPLHIAVEMGLPWACGMKSIFQSNRIGLRVVDKITNLPLFALSAARTETLTKGPWGENDLSSIFELLRSNPEAMLNSGNDIVDMANHGARTSDSTSINIPRKRRRLR